MRGTVLYRFLVFLLLALANLLVYLVVVVVIVVVHFHGGIATTFVTKL